MLWETRRAESTARSRKHRCSSREDSLEALNAKNNSVRHPDLSQNSRTLKANFTENSFWLHFFHCHSKYKIGSFLYKTQQKQSILIFFLYSAAKHHCHRNQQHQSNEGNLITESNDEKISIHTSHIYESIQSHLIMLTVKLWIHVRQNFLLGWQEQKIYCTMNTKPLYIYTIKEQAWDFYQVSSETQYKQKQLSGTK